MENVPHDLKLPTHAQSPRPCTAIENAPIQPDIGSSTPLPDELPLQEFTVFPSLPLELRRLIWGHSLPGPRVIEIFSEDNDNYIMSNERITIRKDTHNDMFALLLACKESEEVVLGAYEKVTARAWNLSLPSSTTILFNYERDIIHLTGLAKDTFLSGASKETLDKMTVLGLGRSELDATLRILPLFSVSQFFHESLPKMSHLKNTVLEDGDARWAGFANLEGNLRGSAPFIFDGIEDKAPTPAVTKTIERVRSGKPQRAHCSDI
jgi:hypothetical protein